MFSPPFLAPKFVDTSYQAGLLAQVHSTIRPFPVIPVALTDFVTNTVGGTAADSHRFPFSSTSVLPDGICSFSVGNYSTAHRLYQIYEKSQCKHTLSFSHHGTLQQSSLCQQVHHENLCGVVRYSRCRWEHEGGKGQDVLKKVLLNLGSEKRPGP